MKPTVGRIVHFRSLTGESFNGTHDPQAAIITRVWSESVVNLTVFPDAGTPFSETSVTFLQSDLNEPRSAFWPPRE